MKNLVLIIIAFLSVQSAKSQTSIDEYLYINKALKEDLASGRDIKLGYSIKLLSPESKVSFPKNEWKTATLYYFVKGETNKAFILRGVDSRGGVYYFCIPTSDANKELWTKTFEDVTSLGESWNTTFLWAMMKLSSKKLL